MAIAGAVDADLVILVLTVVTFATALNLALTLRLSAVVRAREAPEGEIGLPAGASVGAIAARLATDGRPATFPADGDRALVVVFLSTGCPKCREKRAELQALLPAMQRQGVDLWIASPAPAGDLSDLLQDPGLEGRVVALDAATCKALNPHNAAPLYLFIDPDGIVQASDFIGDPDWRAFLAQMLEPADDAPAA